MSMSGNIRVVSDSITGRYQQAANDAFGEIQAQLKLLVNEVVDVHYFGPNAVDFKTKAGQLASEFAKKINTDLATIAGAVKASTSSISSSLGGQPINIQLENSPVAAPAVPPAPPGVVDVNPQALLDLKTPIDNHFAVITEAFQKHLSALVATDWTGHAKDSAVETVSTFTRSAQQAATEAQTALNKYLQDQAAAARAGDK